MISRFAHVLAAALEAHRAFGEVARIELPRTRATAAFAHAVRTVLPEPPRGRPGPGGRPRSARPTRAKR